MTKSDERWERAAKVLAARRVQLDPAYKNLTAFGRDTGVTYKTLQRAEAGTPHNFSSGTLLELDRAYRYQPGSTEALLSGGDPTPIPEEPPMVPAGGTPRPEGGDPDQYIKGAHPLEDGEELRVWKRDDGRLQYRFTKTDSDGHFAAVSAAYPAELPLEAVVKRMRTSADVALM